MTEQVGHDERLRLLVLTSTYPRWAGDPEPGFVHELSRRLAERFDVRVIGPHAAGALAWERLDDVDIHRYRYAPVALETLVNHGGILTNLKRSIWKWLLVPTFLVGQYLALRKALREFRPQVIHAHWLLPQGLIAAWGRQEVPLVATSHGADLFGLRGVLFARLRRWVVPRVSVVTLVSEAMRQRLLAEQPQANAVVMSMGVDVRERFVTAAIKRNPAELLFVGRLVEKKGLHHLLHALPQVIAECPNARLTIAGFGPERERLERIVAEHDLKAHVDFIGAMPQASLPALYQRAALFVAPFIEADDGDQEGLGLVVAEAMACGCPVVVGNVPATQDLVDASSGIRVQVSDHVQLASAIVALLKDDEGRARLGRHARAHVEQHYSWDAVAERYGRLLADVARAGRA
jgi:glycosyltransferase involved in cell wall biosynthesis